MPEFAIFRGLFILILAAAVAYLRPSGVPYWAAAAASAAVALLAILAERRLARISLQRSIGIAAGLIAGLVCAALISVVLARLVVEASPAVGMAQIICLVVLAYFGTMVGAEKGELLNLAAMGGIFGTDGQAGSDQKILDTSVIIDGRIADIAETGFLDGTLVVPQFVLHELQMVADSPDAMKRNRGRRGLDVLQKIQKMPKLNVRIVSEDFPQVREVDMKLIELARLYRARIVTNDFNLNKVAHVRGVDVLNINELANSLKPIVLPGEQMRVFIQKEGKEYNQGVAYLDDGTMVVVDNARRMISRTLDVTVTSVLQTTAGKMIFGRYDERAQAASAAAAGTPAMERRDAVPRREEVVGES